MAGNLKAYGLRAALIERLVLEQSVGSLATSLLEQCSTKPIWVMACNAEKLIAMRHSAELCDLYGSADLWFPDGVGATIAARACGHHVNRITGVDLGEEALRIVGLRNGRVALIGAIEQVSLKVATQAEAGGSEVVYRENGYFGDEDRVIAQLSESKPDLTCIAMGSPRQEYLARRVRTSLKRGLVICLGGSFDVYSGMKARAPHVFRRTGFEWLYRLVSEPARFRRYLALRHYPAVVKDLVIAGRR